MPNINEKPWPPASYRDVAYTEDWRLISTDVLVKFAKDARRDENWTTLLNITMELGTRGPCKDPQAQAEVLLMYAQALVHQGHVNYLARAIEICDDVSRLSGIPRGYVDQATQLRQEINDRLRSAATCG